MCNLGIFGYLFAPLHIIIIIHNLLQKDNAIGFELFPKVKWTYKKITEVI